jgi:hypothetical protein
VLGKQQPLVAISLVAVVVHAIAVLAEHSALAAQEEELLEQQLVMPLHARQTLEEEVVVVVTTELSMLVETVALELL